MPMLNGVWYPGAGESYYVLVTTYDGRKGLKPMLRRRSQNDVEDFEFIAASLQSTVYKSEAVAQDEADEINKRIAAVLTPKRWVPEHGTRYYYVDSCGQVVSEEFTGHSIDTQHISMGNCFQISQYAEEFAPKLKAFFLAATEPK